MLVPLGLGWGRRCLESAITTENQSRRRFAIAGLDDGGQSEFRDDWELYVDFKGDGVFSITSLLIRCLSSYLLPASAWNK